MRVAIATQDLARVDAHLGWARHLMLYEVSAEGYRHLRTKSFHSGLAEDGDYAKLEARLKALKGCALVYVADVGPDGEAALARQKSAPMRQFAGQPVALVLEAMQASLRCNASRWLRREEQQSRKA